MNKVLLELKKNIETKKKTREEAKTRALAIISEADATSRALKEEANETQDPDRYVEISKEREDAQNRSVFGKNLLNNLENTEAFTPEELEEIRKKINNELKKEADKKKEALADALQKADKLMCEYAELYDEVCKLMMIATDKPWGKLDILMGDIEKFRGSVFGEILGYKNK